MDRETLDDRISDYLDGSLTPAELEELIRELRSNPDARRRLLVSAGLDLATQDVAQALRSSAPAPRVTRRRRLPEMQSPWASSLAAASVFVILAILAAIFFSGESSPMPVVQKDRPRVVYVERTPEPPPAPPVPVPPVVKPKTEERPTTPEPRPKPEPVPQPPVPPPVEVPKPQPEPPPPAPSTPKKTEVVVTRIESVEGDVFLVDAGRKSAAAVDAAVRSGQSLQTAAGKVSLKFQDGTRVLLGADSELKLVREEGGKAMSIARGDVTAAVVPQPAGQPLIFTTPHGQAKVLGTTLRLRVEPGPKGSTRLDVEEGKVEFKRLLDGKTALVTTGHFAVVASGLELSVLTPGEILLLPAQGAIVGDEWKVAKDSKAISGVALENSMTRTNKDFSNQVPSFVTFRFYAEADKEYSIWVRGCGLVKDPKFPHAHDAIVLEFPGGKLNKTCQNVGAARPNGYWFEGWADVPGHFWLSGSYWVENGQVRNEDRIAVRFAQTGLQTLILYSAEAPVLIDAVWLSVGQKTRPADGQRGPEADRK